MTRPVVYGLLDGLDLGIAAAPGPDGDFGAVRGILVTYRRFPADLWRLGVLRQFDRLCGALVQPWDRVRCAVYRLVMARYLS